jgi:hypothetical protein
LHTLFEKKTAKMAIYFLHKKMAMVFQIGKWPLFEYGPGLYRSGPGTQSAVLNRTLPIDILIL